MRTGYSPELDALPLLNHNQENYYQNLIGILIWDVELGGIEIHIGFALLSLYFAQPQKGHLDQSFRIFSYFKRYSNSRIVFDSNSVAWYDS